jgi:hypothetical protein
MFPMTDLLNGNASALTTSPFADDDQRIEVRPFPGDLNLPHASHPGSYTNPNPVHKKLVYSKDTFVCLCLCSWRQSYWQTMQVSEIALGLQRVLTRSTWAGKNMLPFRINTYKLHRLTKVKLDSVPRWSL